MASQNPQILSEQIAPGFGEFTSATIPDLHSQFPEAQRWLEDYFTSVLTTRFDDPKRQLVLAYLRRVQHAFDAYHSARDLTSAFLETRGDDPSVRSYYAAVSEWEWFVVDYSMAVDVYRRLLGDLFEKGDGSREFRLYTIANNVKHTSNSFEAHPEGFPAVPLWLSNVGLHSYDDVSVTYIEAGQTLSEMASLAENLRSPASKVEAAGDEG